MADYAGKLEEEMASLFIIGTCQLIPKSFPLGSDQMHDLVMSPSPTPKEYSILCGSVAEFYIRPLNSCVSDTDILACRNHELAFSGDAPVFPSEFSGLADTIMFLKIEPDPRYSGFLRLRVMNEMEYNWKNKTYEVKRTAHPAMPVYIGLNMPSLANSYFVQFRRTLVGSTMPSVVQGPAVKYQIDSNLVLGSDAVRSIFCPEWPIQADDWPGRKRIHGWPTLHTIANVVQNGCHVVYVQHRSSKDDREQWRLSFSLAEINLLQSWTQIQQIVYHLLRFFAKRELLQKDCPKEDEVLCTYHLKTLMLWTCEEMSPEWWNSSSVIAICCELLQTISQWLNKRHCPNYFIPEANLFHESLSSTMLHQIKRRLKEFCKSEILCQWFVRNYILPITRTQLHFLNIQRVEPHFVDYLLPLVQFRKENELESLDALLSYRFSDYNKMTRCIFKSRLSSGLRQNLTFGRYTTNLNPKLHSTMTYFPTTEKVQCFKYYDNLLYILNAAYGLGSGETAWDSCLFLEFVRTISMQSNIIKSQHHNFPKTYTEQSSRFQFLRAQNLMQNLIGSNSQSEFKLLSLMTEAILIKALEYDDFSSNGIAPAALSYLAALQFTRSNYQPESGFCLPFLADKTSHKHKEMETLNAGCLLFIDDVARIVGFCVLHMKTTDNNLHNTNGRLYLDLRLSANVFAHYLTVVSEERITKPIYVDHDLPDSAFPIDEYLKVLACSKRIVSMQSDTHLNAARQRVHGRRDSLTDMEATAVKPFAFTETVIDALMGYALENMISFYRVIRKDFGVNCNTIDCYRALYLYKCRQHDEVLGLCEQILHEPDLQNELQQFAFANVMVLPPLDSFFDLDVRSLLGFHTLFNYLSPLNDKIRNRKVADASVFARCFVNNVFFHDNGLSFFILEQYSVRCHYFIGRHFLAGYLKVRCCIDSGVNCTKMLTEFTTRKARLPFEHIIRKFLIRKLSVIK